MFETLKVYCLAKILGRLVTPSKDAFLKLFPHFLLYCSKFRQFLNFLILQRLMKLLTNLSTELLTTCGENTGILPKLIIPPMQKKGEMSRRRGKLFITLSTS